MARLINASSAREIVFTRNATEAINLVAHSWGNAHLRPGDEVRSPVLHPVCTAGLSTVPSLRAGVEAGGVSGPLKRAGRTGAGVGGGAPQQPGALAAGLPAHGRAAAPRPADGRHAGAGHAGARPCGAASHSPPSILLPLTRHRLARRAERAVRAGPDADAEPEDEDRRARCRVQHARQHLGHGVRRRAGAPGASVGERGRVPMCILCTFVCSMAWRGRSVALPVCRSRRVCALCVSDEA